MSAEGAIDATSRGSRWQTIYSQISNAHMQSETPTSLLARAATVLVTNDMTLEGVGALSEEDMVHKLPGCGKKTAAVIKYTLKVRALGKPICLSCGQALPEA